MLAAIDVPDDVSLSVLIPNERGLDNALEHRERFHEVNVFLSASETHNRNNVNRSIEESLTGLERVLAARPRGGPALRGRDLRRVRLPLRGSRRARARVRRSPAAWSTAGAQEIGFGDTTGMANPVQVRALLRRGARDALGGDVELTAHFHNTRGQGARERATPRSRPASTRSSRASASSAAARCPRAPPATWPPRTCVSMLHEMGIETGVDLAALLDASRAVQEVLGRPLGSHLLTAGPVVWNG